MNRYLVFGPQGSGKTTFGHVLARAIGGKAVDTSAWLKRVEMRRNGGRPIPRASLVALGDAVCAEDPCFLVDRAIEAGADVIIGIRRWAEFICVSAKYRPLVLIYIGRAPGPEVGEDNFELTPDYADHVVEADGEDEMNAAAAHIAAYEGDVPCP